MMTSNFEKVKEFMLAFGQQVLSTTEIPDLQILLMRLALNKEEQDELAEAVDKKDIVAIADALTDILYVTYGFGHALGINLDKCFEEVHNSNMSKLGEDGKPLYRDDGKVLKGPNYKPPNLVDILK